MAEYRVPNINRVIITGHLTADPELKYMPDGRAVCNFQIASSRRYKDKNTGEWVDAPPTFVRVAVFGPTAERLGETLHKGNAVFVEGRLQFRSWETSEGEKRSILEIVAFRAQSLMKTTIAGATPGEAPPTKGEEHEENEKEGQGQEEGLSF